MAAVSREQILEGPIIKVLFLLGWPVMVSSLLETLYTIVDTFWLGQLGDVQSKNAVAALQVSWPVIGLLMSLAIGFGVAGIALISQYTGAKNEKEAARSAGQLLSISIVLGLVVGVAGSALTPFMVALLDLEEGISSMATTYMRVIFLGLPFMFTEFSFAFMLRARGNTMLPMMVQGGAIFLNALLDPLLIFGLVGFPALGVLGAAIATIFSMFVSASFSLYILFSGKGGILVEASDLIPERKRVMQIFRVGLPSSFGMMGETLGFVVLMYVIARLPEQATILAAYGLGDRITGLMFIAINGLGAGVSTMLGQCVGADRMDRAQEAAMKGMTLMFLILVASCLVIYPIRRQVIGFFINSTEVVDEGATFLAIFLFGVPFYGIFSAVSASFAGAGHNVPPMILGLVRLWLLRIPLAYLLGLAAGWGASGVWVGMGASNILGALLALAVFKTGMWKKKII